MELYVETLTGTAFELRVSPYETVIDVKAKIQKFEGIPISQQHLLWKSMELEDNYSLKDYRITNGSTLQLVLSMRCGPINTKRVAHEEANQEVPDYVELTNREGILRRLKVADKPVTYIVFRDGDRLNLYRLYRDDSESPETAGRIPLYTKYEGNEDEGYSVPDAGDENEVTMSKMEILRAKLASRIKIKHGKTKAVNFKPQGEANIDRRISAIDNNPVTNPMRSTCLPPVLKREYKSNRRMVESAYLTQENQVVIQAIRDKSVSKGRNHECDLEINKPRLLEEKRLKDTDCGSIRERNRLCNIGFPVSSKATTKNLAHIRHDACKRTQMVSGGSSNLHHSTIEKVSSASENISPPTLQQHNRVSEPVISPAYVAECTQISKLPDVPVDTFLLNKKASRCSACNRKLGLANVFVCRCRQIFCSRHRHAEVHGCTFDYKSDGRKALEEKNPAIAAPKLPKI